MNNPAWTPQHQAIMEACGACEKGIAFMKRMVLKKAITFNNSKHITINLKLIPLKDAKLADAKWLGLGGPWEEITLTGRKRKPIVIKHVTWRFRKLTFIDTNIIFQRSTFAYCYIYNFEPGKVAFLNSNIRCSKLHNVMLENCILDACRQSQCE